MLQYPLCIITISYCLSPALGLLFSFFLSFRKLVSKIQSTYGMKQRWKQRYKLKILLIFHYCPPINQCLLNDSSMELSRGSCSSHLRADVTCIRQTKASHPKFAFTPTFKFCNPICSYNCGVVFSWKYILVFEKWLFFVRPLKYANFHREYYSSCVTSCNEFTWPPIFLST